MTESHLTKELAWDIVFMVTDNSKIGEIIDDIQLELELYYQRRKVAEMKEANKHIEVEK